MGATRASETLPGGRSDGDGDLPRTADQPSDDLSQDRRGVSRADYSGVVKQSQNCLQPFDSPMQRTILSASSLHSSYTSAIASAQATISSILLGSIPKHTARAVVIAHRHRTPPAASPPSPPPGGRCTRGNGIQRDEARGFCVCGGFLGKHVRRGKGKEHTENDDRRPPSFHRALPNQSRNSLPSSVAKKSLSSCSASGEGGSITRGPVLTLSAIVFPFASRVMRR